MLLKAIMPIRPIKEDFFLYGECATDGNIPFRMRRFEQVKKKKWASISVTFQKYHPD